MNNWPLIIAAISFSYVLGSIPTGLWLGLHLRGVDIREHGSKNIGATNTLRVLGKPLGAAALAGDMLKGLVAVVLGVAVRHWTSVPGIVIVDCGIPADGFVARPEFSHLPLACGIAAILGHSFSLFLRFTGGKGVATSTGVFLGLLPIPTLIAAVVFGVSVYFTRMVSLGSILAAITLSVACFFVPAPMAVRVIVVLVATLIIWKHRANIGRILRGEENKF